MNCTVRVCKYYIANCGVTYLHGIFVGLVHQLIISSEADTHLSFPAVVYLTNVIAYESIHTGHIIESSGGNAHRIAKRDMALSYAITQ